MLVSLLQRTSGVPAEPGGETPTQVAEPVADAAKEVVELDPVSLILNASGPVFVVVWLLVFALSQLAIIAIGLIPSRWSEEMVGDRRREAV